MRQFWVGHPDGYLIRPTQRILSVNPTTYRRQVADAFQRDTPRITKELLTVKQTADKLAQQGDILGAATIYEILVTEIFEQSHLYYNAERWLDWTRPAAHLRNQVHGWGSQGAMATIDGQTYLVCRARTVASTANTQPGALLGRTGTTLLVQTGEGALLIENFKSVL